MDRESWTREFGEPAPHVPESVVALTTNKIDTSEIAANAAARAALTSFCESPIEVDLGAAISLIFEQSGNSIRMCPMQALSLPTERLVLVPQFAWSFYRSDWATIPAGRSTGLLIECDGFEFHSSPDQVRHDERKDADALAAGHKTIRLAGGAIYRDPYACARHIFDLVHSL